MIIITKTIGALAILYGFMMAYTFLREYAHMTELEIWVNHWQGILPILCTYYFRAILIELEKS